MADPDLAASRHMPLAGLALVAPKCAAVRIEPVAPRTRLSLRTRGTGLSAAQEGLGFALPTTPCRAATNGDLAALWLGPDEWLVVAPAARGEAVRADLTAALAGVRSSMVDISHRHVALTVAGPRAADALNAFVALDLDERAFPVGMCTRTLLGKAEIVLWRTGDDIFHLETARSLGAYVWASLEEARREYLDP